MIELGSSVPLNLQLFDGKSGMSVLVQVRDPSNSIIFEGQLVDVGGGLYINRSFVMPEVDYVIAQYTVFDGKKESDEYEKVSETFFRIKPEPVMAVAAAVQNISKTIEMQSSDDFIQGILSSEKADDFIEGVLSWSL